MTELTLGGEVLRVVFMPLSQVRLAGQEPYRVEFLPQQHVAPDREAQQKRGGQQDDNFHMSLDDPIGD